MQRQLESISRDLFPRAALYAPPPGRGPGEVREPPARWRAFPYAERHLQCVWFDPSLRPATLTTSRGESVTVEDPGVWNLEAGPDFLGAAVRVGPEQRRLTGDVEIHIHPADWKRHGHADDPRYDRVRLHVTYFAGALPDGEFRPGTVQVALQEPLAARPSFSFENIDIAAYPYAVRAPVPPCLEELKNWSRDAKELVLDAAGEERLRRKAERMALAIEDRGTDQVLYEEILVALGYKQNKSPFRQLAAALPHAELREAAGGRAETAYALLLGVAGLLPSAPKQTWDEASKKFFRTLWDAWWKRREPYATRIMSAGAWQTAGLRPANHPARRIMAAALLFTGRKTLHEQWTALANGHAGDCVERVTDALGGLQHDYWDRRWSLGGAPSRKKAALLGADRAEAVALNVFIPWLAVANIDKPFARDLLAQLPAEGDNALIRQTAFNLFGPHHPRALYKTGLRRQGLIQVFHDYCLNDRSRCAACTFPALLREHRKAREAR